jgi:hypothetical protein
MGVDMLYGRADLVEQPEERRCLKTTNLPVRMDRAYYSNIMGKTIRFHRHDLTANTR